jgi:hypothetical protein
MKGAITFADETFFVPFTHMCIQFVFSEKALSTELAKRVYTAFNRLFESNFPRPGIHSWQVNR